MPYRSPIEPLESRIAPANVTATFAGGKLVVTGDAGDNAVYLGALDNGFSVGVGMGSHLIFNGTDLGDAASKDVQALVTDVSVDLGAGNDSFESFGGHFTKNVTIKGGAGNDTIKTATFRVGGTFTVDGGADDDTLMLEQDLQAGKLVLDGGAGANQIQFNYTNLGVEGDSSIKGGTGVDTITTKQGSNFSFGGDLAIALGGGNDSIGFGQDLSSEPHLFEVGGDFSITEAPHAGTFTVKFSPDILRIGGNLSVTTDGKTGGTNNVELGGGFVHVFGKTTLKSTGAAVDTYSVAGTQLQLVGGVAVDLGDGANTIGFTGYGSATLGSLAYKGGAGDDKLTFSGDVPFSVLGLTDVKLGEGTNEVSEAASSSTYHTLFLGGGLAVTGGKGADTVSFNVFDLAIGGKGAKLTLGDGANTALFQGYNSVAIYGNFTSTSGVGDTSVKIFGSAFSNCLINLRGGVSTSFGGGQGSLEIGAPRLEVGGGLTFTAKGAGDDHLNIASAAIGIKGAITATGDAGALNVDVQTDYPVDIGSVSITTKAGGGSTKFAGGGNIYGKFTYNGGTGANNVDLGRESGYPYLNFYDVVSITSKAAAGTESLKLHHVTALAAFNAKLGGANNTVALDDSYFLGAVNIDTGAGSDAVNVGAGGVGAGLFYGPVKILTGAGDDTVRLTAQFFVPVASTLIDGGDGADTVNNTLVTDANLGFFTPTEKNFETTTP